MEKFYAVRNGRKTGIFHTWDECKEQIHMFSGAEYKRCGTLKEAQDYLSYKPNIGDSVPSEAVAYVDGSYDVSTGIFGCGVVLFHNGIKEELYESFKNDDLATMRNVAGEIKGAELAMQFCVDNNISSLDIYYDYLGIEHWCTGAWSANKKGTQAYKYFYDEVSQTVRIRFFKVKGHSGNKYNEEADRLAKQAVSMYQEKQCKYYNIFNGHTGAVIATGFGTERMVHQHMRNIASDCRYRNRIVELEYKMYPTEIDGIMDILDTNNSKEDSALDATLLPVRAYNALLQNSINTNFKLAALSETELMHIPNISKKAIVDIREYLNTHGLTLNDEKGDKDGYTKVS